MNLSPRPRLTLTAPLLHGSGELHVVGSRDVTSIPDPLGAVHRLAVLADGSRSTPELVSTLVADFPQLVEQDVVDAVWELEAAGLLEDCAPRRRLTGTRRDR